MFLRKNKISPLLKTPGKVFHDCNSYCTAVTTAEIVKRERERERERGTLLTLICPHLRLIKGQIKIKTIKGYHCGIQVEGPI